MPKIEIKRTIPGSADKVFEQLKKILENDADLKKLDPGYSCQFDEKSFSGTAKGSKFEAELKMKAENQQNHVNLSVSIPFLLTPFKGLIETTLNKKLDKVVA